MIPCIRHSKQIAELEAKVEVLIEVQKTMADAVAQVLKTQVENKGEVATLTTTLEQLKAPAPVPEPTIGYH